VRDLLLRPGVRLLSMTGPPGIGKTRLSIEAAARLVDNFSDGVWFISLAPITDPALVASAIAQALGLKESGARPLSESLTEHLLDKQMLLLLDNFEQVVEAAPLVAEMLAAAPGIKVLVTSREVLHVRGEQDFPVPPLALPPQGAKDFQGGEEPPLSYDRLTQYESVQLFTQRASEAKLDFTLAPENAQAVAEICRRLDGLPLAIELAAARVKVLPPQAMLERLAPASKYASSLQLLTGGARDLPARQQTLRSAIEWSYDLLNEKEKRLFRRMAVFRGGCTLAAIEGVCNAGKDLDFEPLDGVASLLDKSLLKQEMGEEADPRFFMLETILEYAGEKLRESREEAAVRRQHALYFAKFAEHVQPLLVSSEYEVWLARMDTEHDNIRAALQWTLAPEGDARVGLQLAASLRHFWSIHSYYHEASEWLHKVLARPGAQERTALRGMALAGAGAVAYMMSDYASSRSLYEESLALFRELGDKQGIAEALDGLGEIATEVGDYETAVPLLEEFLALNLELGDKRGIANSLIQLGWAALRPGDYTLAVARLEEALRLLRQLGDVPNSALALAGLGEIALRQGNYERATTLLEESLAIRRKLGHKWGISVCLGSLGWVALRRGDYEQATRTLVESLLVRQTIGDKGGIAWCLEKLAEAASAQQNARRAARLYGAASALRQRIGSVVDPADVPEYGRNLAEVRAKLDEATWQRAWGEGQAMTMEAAIVYAQALATESEVAPTRTGSSKAQFGGLTEREVEIAAQIAQSKSNSEIATELVITKRTVETHIGNILAKLGFTSRGQIAAWAIKKGLLNSPHQAIEPARD
jgi:predicted ATPase/DNA-binding CsgD family transcriptional regulator